MLMVGLLLLGLAAYPLLPVAALPNVNYPTLSVTAQLPGADPQTIASSVVFVSWNAKPNRNIRFTRHAAASMRSVISARSR